MRPNRNKEPTMIFAHWTGSLTEMLQVGTLMFASFIVGVGASRPVREILRRRQRQ